MCYYVVWCLFFFFFKQKTAYEMRISDWTSDVCSSDLADDACRLVAGRVAGVGQIVKDLTRTQHQSLDLVIGGCARIGQDAPEMAVADEILDARYRRLVPQQRFGRHDHQRLPERPQNLAAQDVVIIGRRGAVGDLDVVFGAQLQIALQPGRAVLDRKSTRLNSSH